MKTNIRLKPIDFRNAYYIKLGKKGKWEKSSLRENKIRIGWEQTKLRDINSGNWAKIEKELRREIKYKGVATRDYHALRLIAESTPDDIWITFHLSQLWWCKPGKAKILEDTTSKYRKVAGKWHNYDIKHSLLIVSQIPGTLSKIQGFRGTICQVKEKEVGHLRRLLNDQPSEDYEAITKAAENLATEIEQGLKLLFWKDFETLVDLLFRGTGWRRISLLGETMKDVDLELEEPITRDLYQVQIKSEASMTDFRKYAKISSGVSFRKRFRKRYFVVHTPTGNWNDYKTVKNVELLRPKQIASMVVSLGLTNWLLNKIR